MLNEPSAKSRENRVEEVLQPGQGPPCYDGGFWSRPMNLFVLFLLALTGCFVRPLYALLQYSLHNEFFSYIPLIPFISLYLVWLKKAELPRWTGGSWKWALAPALGAVALLIGWHYAFEAGWLDQKEDYLTFAIAGYLLFATAGCLAFFGSAISRALAFPLAFLAFMIPMPGAMLDAVTTFFQYTSAYTAVGMLKAAFMPVYLSDLTLNLPAFPIIVAPECSGIHSTMVLLITAFLAGHLFLRTGWKRVFLVVMVIPLAILRNGFRIFVISELCVRVSHDMINSPIHRHGGPLFFALSLIPFFAVLFWLRKSELTAAQSVQPAANS